MDVAERFAATAAVYDRSRRILVPCFDDFYGTAIAEARAVFAADAPLRVVDLGAGTGLLSAFLADAFPDATFTLVDVTREMLDRARARFASAESRFAFELADFAAWPIPDGVDLIVSALAVHHLHDDAKRDLFARALAALRPGGAFINADEVLGPTPELDARYHAAWRAGARALGATDDDFAAAEDRMKADRCATLDDQLRWLRDAGFAHVHCAFKQHMFVVYSGQRPA
jgi:tRNA (cmo5U34)-methyltransferase